MTILEFGHRWLPFTFLVSGLVTVHTTQKCRVELGIGAFLSFTLDIFSFVQSLYRVSHSVLCFAQTPGSYTPKMKELSQNCNQKFFKLLELGL